MASGKPAADPPALNATRQMLDELDALMERMLAVPIAAPEEPAPPQTVAPQAPSRPRAPTLTLLQTPVEEAPASFPPPSEMAGYPSLTYPPAEASEPYPELPALPDAPAATPEPLSFRVLPPASKPSLDELLADVPEPPASLAAWFILPVLWGNRLFDQGTLLLGENGSWLRGTIGRSALGMAGLILFGAALLWLARDWLGWTW